MLYDECDDQNCSRQQSFLLRNHDPTLSSCEQEQFVHQQPSHHQHQHEPPSLSDCDSEADSLALSSELNELNDLREHCGSEHSLDPVDLQDDYCHDDDASSYSSGIGSGSEMSQPISDAAGEAKPIRAERWHRQSVADRRKLLQKKAEYIRRVLESRSEKPRRKKVKVHEVILVILLNCTYGDASMDLQEILSFCNSNGDEQSSETTHFKTLDTNAMGLLWQQIKGNTKSNYDTFARAMRVRRERSSGFFEYLEAGKGRRKRIYKLGQKTVDEMRFVQKALQSCRH